MPKTFFRVSGFIPHHCPFLKGQNFGSGPSPFSQKTDFAGTRLGRLRSRFSSQAALSPFLDPGGNSAILEVSRE